MQPTLKAPGTKSLRLKHDELLSSFAFKFSLRRYSLVGDPALGGVTHIFVDEVHERTADADFLLIHLKGMLQRQAAEQGRLKAGTYTCPLFGST
jgi:hypothetical protein